MRLSRRGLGRHRLAPILALPIAALLGAVTLSPCVSHAVVLASDTASDPVYADGWQAGDNGGTGFTAWNFDTDTLFPVTPGIQSIDDGLKAGGANSSPFNAIGRAWRIAVPSGGLPRAGRGFAPLEIGQTLMVTVDNPAQHEFFKGYFVRLSGGTGGVKGNVCYGGVACSTGIPANLYPTQRMRFQTFEYFTNGEWSIEDSGSVDTGVFDVDTSIAGATFQVTRTGTQTYDVAITSLGGGSSFTASRTFGNIGAPPPDWIEFTMFNTVTNVSFATDFYIRSMQILPEPGSLALLCGAGAVGLLARRRTRK